MTYCLTQVAFYGSFMVERLLTQTAWRNILHSVNNIVETYNLKNETAAANWIEGQLELLESFQLFYHRKPMPFALNIKCYSSNNNQKKKQKIKNKQQEFLNKGDRSKEPCAKILMNFQPKFYLWAPLRE